MSLSQLIQFPIRHDLPFINNDNLIANGLYFLHNMRRKNYGLSFSQLPDQIPDAYNLIRVQPRSWFIKDKNLGIGQYCLG